MNANDPENSANRKAHDPEILGPEGNEQVNKQRHVYRTRYTAPYNSAFAYWNGAPLTGTGCLGPAITFALCMICLGKYGVLAAIGFVVFYVIGSVLGTLHTTRRVMSGLPVSPWGWRTGNWLVSFLLTVWLAGGFRD